MFKLWSIIPLPYKLGGLAFLVAAIFLIYNIHKRSLIKEGYQSCQIESQEIIDKLKEKSNNDIIETQSKYKVIYRDIATKDGGDTVMPMWTDFVASMYDDRREDNQ